MLLTVHRNLNTEQIETREKSTSSAEIKIDNEAMKLEFFLTPTFVVSKDQLLQQDTINQRPLNFIFDFIRPAKCLSLKNVLPGAKLSNFFPIALAR